MTPDQIPVAPGQWPLGFPIQGLPRAAVTFNLNYVYDEDAEEWVRQTPFSGGGGGGIEVVGAAEFSLNDGQTAEIETGVTAEDVDGGGLDAFLCWQDGATLPDGRVTEQSDGSQGFGISYEFQYDPEGAGWIIDVTNKRGFVAALRIVVYRLPAASSPGTLPVTI